MDQVKPILVALRKHHFWVLFAASLVIGLMSWTWATADLAKRFGDRKKGLEGLFAGLLGVSGQPNPPNERVIDALEVEHNRLKKNVLGAWKVLYQEQQENNPVPPVLGEDFVRAFNRSSATKEELPPAYRTLYMNFIKDHIKTLPEKIRRRKLKEGEGAKPAPAAAAPGVADPQPKPAEPMIGLVDWNDADWKRLQARFDWQVVPSTQQVRLAQEDLWIYEALLRTIAGTNEGAGDYSDAPVREIIALETAQDAVAAWKAASECVARLPESQKEQRQSETSSHSHSPGQPQKEERLEENRYIEDSGRPLAGSAKHPYAEFKMMPIRILVLMRQSSIPKLLVECANSNMPIEIRYVRYRPGKGQVLDLMQGAAKTGHSGGKHGGMPAMGMGGAPAVAAPAAVKSGAADDDPYSEYAQVELLGLIYIFNPPDEAKLGTGSASEQAGEAPTEEKPAAEPPVEKPDAGPEKPAAPPGPAPQPVAPALPAGPAPAAPPGGPAAVPPDVPAKAPGAPPVAPQAAPKADAAAPKAGQP